MGSPTSSRQLSILMPSARGPKNQPVTSRAWRQSGTFGSTRQRRDLDARVVGRLAHGEGEELARLVGDRWLPAGESVDAAPAVAHPDRAGGHLVGHPRPSFERSALVMDAD